MCREIRAERASSALSDGSFARSSSCESCRSRRKFCESTVERRRGESAMRNIRRGDEVVVIAGKNKGQRGKVRDNLIKDDRVIIEGVNIVIKHVRRGRARQAGRVEVEAPLYVSKVMLVCPN